MLRRFTIALFFTCLFNEVHAQSCDQRLEEAMRAYYGGNLREVEMLIDYTNCAQSLTKEQRVNALRIIVISNLFLKEQEKADDAMLKLLKLNPEYKLTDADPPEFENLLGSYKRKPLISIGFYGGFNFAKYNIISPHSMDISSSPSVYSGKSGFQLGFNTFYHLKKKLWLNTGIGTQYRQFKVTKILSGLDYYSLRTIESNQKQYYYDVPAAIRFVHIKGKYQPFLEGGITTSFLFYSKAKFRTTTNGFNVHPRISETEWEITNLRNKINICPYAAAGALIKIDKKMVGVKISYAVEQKGQVRHSSIYEKGVLKSLGYIDDDFNANLLMISVLYSSITTYKLKKIHP
jgi:hypothetical protein